MQVRTLIAEDEPLLAQSLLRNLSAHWPDLELVGIAENGDSAVAMALAASARSAVLRYPYAGQDRTRSSR